MTPASSPGRDSWWFAVWAAIGGLFALSLLAGFTIGMFILAVPAIATVALLRVPNASVGRSGLISGVSLPLLFVAFANRHGPGTNCNATRFRCHDEWSPWPWLLAGIIVAAAGGTVFARARRKARKLSTPLTNSAVTTPRSMP